MWNNDLRKNSFVHFDLKPLYDYQWMKNAKHFYTLGQWRDDILDVVHFMLDIFHARFHPCNHPQHTTHNHPHYNQ